MGQTHDLRYDGDRLVKRYTSWERGEHCREWTVLAALHAQVPDLVPGPLEADLSADPPWVAMSRLLGTPLSGALSAEPLRALEATLRRVWSVPVGDLPARRFHPAEARSVVRSGLAAAARPLGPAGDAYDFCLSYLAGPPYAGGADPVIGHGDANLANYLWDGVSVRLVDFEDAGASDVAYELGFLVEHLSSRATDWTPLLANFANEIDPGRLRDARLTSAAHWLLLLLPGGPADRRNPPGTLAAQADRILTQLV